MVSTGKLLQLVNLICLVILAGYFITKTPWSVSKLPKQIDPGVLDPKRIIGGYSAGEDGALLKELQNQADSKQPHIELPKTVNFERSPVEVKELNIQCSKPFYNLAFVKTHKCASDTVAAHFMRLAEEYKLEMPLPTGQWNLMWPYFPGQFYKSRKKSRRFDLQTLHMMYYPQTWDQFMEPGYKLFSIVRQPYQQFKSFFNYFGLSKKLNQELNIPVNETFQTFIRESEKYYPKIGKPLWKNSMLFDFGFRNEMDIPELFVQKLSEKFSLVMISDYFDESMIVLRHTFCLKMRDILIKIKNVSRKYSFGPKGNQNTPEEQKLEDHYKKYAYADYVLFDLFNATLWKKVAAIPNFKEELSTFRNYSMLMDAHCTKRRARRSTGDLIIPAGKFNEEIVIDKPFCERVQLSVLRYIDRLKLDRFDKDSPSYARQFIPEK